MAKYLGETLVDQKDTPFKDYTENDWSLYFIMRYGGIDGAHHKDWVMDQVVRILNGTELVIALAKWEDGQEEYRVCTGKPSQKYKDWVMYVKSGKDGPDTYSYYEGIAP